MENPIIKRYDRLPIDGTVILFKVGSLLRLVDNFISFAFFKNISGVLYSTPCHGLVMGFNRILVTFSRALVSG